MLVLSVLSLAAATSYTDTVGSTSSYRSLEDAWSANFYRATADVRLTGLEVYAWESDSDCYACYVYVYLWTKQSSGSWTATSLGTVTVWGTSATWQTFSVASPPTLTAGTDYGIGFFSPSNVEMKFYNGGSAVDTVWATALGYDYGSMSSTGSRDLSSSSVSVTDDYGFYMKITVEAPDDDRDGVDTLDDCDDTDASAYPGAAEVWYDGVDQACDDGDDYDQDGDGWSASAYGGDDCDDLHADAHPSGWEVWYDGIDQDCSGGSDYDQDLDGDDIPEAGGGDCDDEDADIHSAAQESWYDGVDQNCDGADDYDQDGDGHATPSVGGDDCDDTDPTRNVDCSDPGGDTGGGDTDTDGGDTDGNGGGDGDGDGVVDDGGDEEKGGFLCMVASAAPMGWGLLAGVLAVARRRRRA